MGKRQEETVGSRGADGAGVRPALERRKLDPRGVTTHLSRPRHRNAIRTLARSRGNRVAPTSRVEAEAPRAVCERRAQGGGCGGRRPQGALHGAEEL